MNGRLCGFICFGWRGSPPSICWLARAVAVFCLVAIAAAPPAAKEAEELDVPTAWPAGAVLPEEVVLPAVRPDVYVGRATAMSRMLQCPKCGGSGVKVTRRRAPAAVMEKPKVSELREDCPDCKGFGFALNPQRVEPVLDSFVMIVGALPSDLPTSPKQIEKARQALCLLGSSGELAEKITAADRSEVATDRPTRKGSAISVIGMVGKPFPAGEGVRLTPILVDGRGVICLRSPAINAAPATGKVLAGGVVAGQVEHAIWQWGKVLVLDHGYLVPCVEPPHKGPGIDADHDGVPDGPSDSPTGSAKNK